MPVPEKLMYHLSSVALQYSSNSCCSYINVLLIGNNNRTALAALPVLSLPLLSTGPKFLLK